MAVGNCDGVVPVHEQVVFDQQTGGLARFDESPRPPVGFGPAVPDRDTGRVREEDDPLARGLVGVEKRDPVDDEVSHPPQGNGRRIKTSGVYDGLSPARDGDGLLRRPPADGDELPRVDSWEQFHRVSGENGTRGLFEGQFAGARLPDLRRPGRGGGLETADGGRNRLSATAAGEHRLKLVFGIGGKPRDAETVTRTLNVGGDMLFILRPFRPDRDPAPPVAVGSPPGDDGAVVGNIPGIQVLEGHRGEFRFRQFHLEGLGLEQFRMIRLEFGLLAEVAEKLHGSALEGTFPRVVSPDAGPADGSLYEVVGDDARHGRRVTPETPEKDVVADQTPGTARLPAERGQSLHIVGDDVVPGALLSVVVDAEIELLNFAVAQCRARWAAPVADDQIVVSAAEGHVVAPVIVPRGPVVLEQTPRSAVEDHPAGGVVIKGAVRHRDVACRILFVGPVHADVDRFARVHEGQIFHVDIAPVDPQADPVAEERDPLLVQSGEVDQQALFRLVVIKGPGQFPRRLFAGNGLQFDARGQLVDRVVEGRSPAGEDEDRSVLLAVKEFLPADDDGLFALHPHDADGRTGFAALFGKPHGVFFDIDLDLGLEVLAPADEERVPRPQQGGSPGDGPEGLFPASSVIPVIAFRRDVKGAAGPDHGPRTVIGDIHRLKKECPDEHRQNQKLFHSVLLTSRTSP